MSEQFRKANKKDANKILQMYEDAKKQKFCLWNKMYPTIDDINEDIRNDNLYVLTFDDNIVGSISIVTNNELDELDCWKYKKACEIARVVISKEYQGNGYTLILLEEIEKLILSRNINAIHLLVGVNNIPAYKTYLKSNYKVVGDVHMYSNDYYACEKKL